MTNSYHVLTVPEVRVKLDSLIQQVELRVDNMEVALADFSPNGRPPTLAARLDHATGRLHGLKEARELLDALEQAEPYVPAIDWCPKCGRAHDGPCWPLRTIASDLAEDR